MLLIRGQVVVYGIVGCPHCLEVKQILREKGIPHIDVCIDKFPDVRDWLKKKTGRPTVPQIFFNDKHVGGKDDLKKIIENEKQWEELVKEIRENESIGALKIPHPSEAIEDMGFVTFACEDDPLADIVDELMCAPILREKRLSIFTKAKNVFTGKDFISWCMSIKHVDKIEAYNVASDLLKKKFILPVKMENYEMFVDNNEELYRVNDCSDMSALNAGSSQKCNLKNPADLAEHLNRALLLLCNNFFSSDGKVNYEAMKKVDMFKDYLKMSRELQRVPIEEFDESVTKTFFINIYNSLVIHGLTVHGAPTNWVTRFRFFMKTSYVIGGYSFTLSEIENGILRGNSKGPLQLFLPFSSGDPRIQFCVTKVDPRIHFALNCGAQSCPSVKTYSAKNIDKELQISAEAFLETDDNLRVEKDTGIVWLSQIFQWYASDFGESSVDLIQWIFNNVQHSKKKSDLEKLLISGSWRLQYLPYNWSPNELKG